ncbi:MAG: Asp/Glu/hydantoin racemase [Gaiella sp.]
MRNHITFLHTSPVHVETFERLVKGMDPRVQTTHIVAEDLLSDAQIVGIDDPNLVDRIHKAMTDAASGGSAIVVCTCSTIGGAAERTPTNGRFKALRIDRAMADRAVQSGPNILVVAALESTLQPTTDLIQESAAALNSVVEIKHLLVEGAWSHFMQGDREAYIGTVVAAVRSAPTGADVVVLAQASMAVAAEQLHDLGVEVLSSPTLGVKYIVEQL